LSDLQISAFYPVLLTFSQRIRHLYTVSVPIHTTGFLSAFTVWQVNESSDSRRPCLTTRNVAL
jgi:hypothetical protein